MRLRRGRHRRRSHIVVWHVVWWIWILRWIHVAGGAVGAPRANLGRNDGEEMRTEKEEEDVQVGPSPWRVWTVVVGESSGVHEER